MLVAGLGAMAFFGLIVYLMVHYVDSMSKTFLKYFGYYLLVTSTLELLFLFWILGYIAVSDWSLWNLTTVDFWREQLSVVYFIKEWVYSFVWNDLLDFFWVFLPAVVFVGVRTTLTSIFGLRALRASRA